MVDKKSETTVEMVEKTEPVILDEKKKKPVKKLNTYVIVPDNVAIAAETEAEAVKIYNSQKLKKDKK